MLKVIKLPDGSGAWSIGSVRASGAVGPEFEPTFCHSLFKRGSLAGSCKLRASGAADSLDVSMALKRWSHQKALALPWGIKERTMSGVRAQQRSPGNHPKCRHQQKSLSPPERWTPHRGPGVEYPAEATLDGDGRRNHPMEPKNTSEDHPPT